VLVARLEVSGKSTARGRDPLRRRQHHHAARHGWCAVRREVENFSRTGFLFTGDADLPVGTLVSLGLSGAGVREAKVVRRDGQQLWLRVPEGPLTKRELIHAFKGQARSSPISPQTALRRAARGKR
jgi:hypothetical protein